MIAKKLLVLAEMCDSESEYEMSDVFLAEASKQKIVEAQMEQRRGVDFLDPIVHAIIKAIQMTPIGQKILYRINPMLEALRTGRAPAGGEFHVPGTQLGSSFLRPGGEGKTGRTDEDIEKYRIVGMNDLIEMKQKSSGVWARLLGMLITGLNRAFRRLYAPEV